MEDIEIKCFCVYKNDDHEIILSNNKLMIIGKYNLIILLENIVKLYFQRSSFWESGYMQIIILSEDQKNASNGQEEILVYFLKNHNEKFVKINELIQTRIVNNDKNIVFDEKKSQSNKNLELDKLSILNKGIKVEKLSNKNEIKPDNKTDANNIIECVNCRSILNSSSKFCTKCGFEIVFVLICKGCNKEIKSSSKFCKFCGNRRAL